MAISKLRNKLIPSCPLLLLFLLLLCICQLQHFASASWLYLGLELLNNNQSPWQPINQTLQPSERLLQHVERCRQQTELLRNKVDACSQRNLELMDSLVRGSAVGLLECQWQFRLERWNCNLLGADNQLLEHVLLQGTRETAYLHAITSASLVHSLTSTCSAGLINECTCDQSSHVVTSADDGWQWGGCSDNIEVGIKMSQKLIDHIDDIVGHNRATPTTTTATPSPYHQAHDVATTASTTGDDDFSSTSSSDYNRNYTGFGDDRTTTANGSLRRDKKLDGNYVINMDGSSKSRRSRRGDVVKIKNELTKKKEMEGLERSIRGLVNLHNNEVGRKTISSMMSHACRCHGVSGSCAVRTCWRALPDFRKVGDQLKLKYESSVEISPLPALDSSRRRSNQLRRSISENTQSRMSLTALASYSPYLTSGKMADGERLRFPFYLKRREKRKSREPISDSELVFLEKSPNYCRLNQKKGVQGTKGRRCDVDQGKPNSCHSLCCGRGYKTAVVRRKEKCECRFVWCCEVVCRMCEIVEEIHTCK